ncbi:MAG: LuxR C-terminal-related transcriptional regulator [Thermomicrobiales bacterium]|nr:LuxR C-terminal-related transcriptional regulator [Thermomicrobiales bacterium]
MNEPVLEPGAEDNRWEHWAGLSAPQTRFIGRDRQLQQLQHLLSEPSCRLLTITGPGGVGKTRLALALAAHPDFAVRVGVVALAEVQDATLIPATILRALGLEVLSGQAIEDVLVASLADRTVLVLDNLEHLHGAPVVARLLDQCHGLRILATSRVPIGISGEHLYPLEPLEVRVEGSAAIEAPAVQLFIDRVRLALPSFQMTPGALTDITAVCQQLDGMPLAIELAAAHCRQLAPHALAQRIHNRATLPASGLQNVPPRHQSMQATVAWSVGLLDPKVAELWRTMGVFEGGFTLETAEAMAGASGLPVASVPAMLDELEMHGLVRLGTNSLGEPRYSMHPITREVALTALQAEEHYPEVLEAQAEIIAQFCAEVEPGLMGTEGVTWFARVNAEMANIRAVLNRDQKAGQHLRPLTMVTHLHWFWTDPGYLQEGLTWLSGLLAEADESVPASLRMSALSAASSLADWLYQTEIALDYATQAFDLARETGDRLAEMKALLDLGNVYFDESDLVPAERYFREGHALAQELQDGWHMAAFANLRATLAAAQGDPVSAVAWHRAALAGWQATGFQSHTGIAATGLVVVLAETGEFEEAASLLLQSVPQIDRSAVSPEATMAIAGAALIAMGVDLPIPAVRFVGAATHLRRVMGADFRPYFVNMLAKQIERLRSELTAPVFSRAWSEGVAQTLPEALDAMMGFLSDLPPRTGLTSREREVLRFMAEGASDVEIAERLYISRHTASKHVAAILEKLQAPNRTTAVAIAYRRGIVNA